MMIDGDYIDTLADAIEAIEQTEGRDEAYRFAVKELNRQESINSSWAVWLGVLLALIIVFTLLYM